MKQAGVGNKSVIVHRFGAIGDFIITTPIYPLLKKEGWNVTLNTTKRGMEILKHNPCIDKFRLHNSSIKPNEELDKYIQELGKNYDRTIDLCESIEGTLSKVEWRDDFFWSKEKRHKECNVNFYDRTLEIAGYKNLNGYNRNGRLYFSRLEEMMVKDIRKKHKKHFLILWSLAGSSAHKAYPFAEYAAKIIINRYPEAFIITVGDAICELIEPKGVRIKNCSGKWGIRKSLLMTKYANLVIGTDTGLMHGAGSFDTPKILLLSSTTHENISKYWANVVTLSANVECQPCHQLHYNMKHCILDAKLKTPICMTKLKVKDVLDAVDKVYQDWRKERYDSTNNANSRQYCN